MIRVTRHKGQIARFIFLVTLFATGCASSTEAWQRIQSTGTLRVGLDPTYPPFETADDGELRGIDVDLARALGRELDLDVEFVYFGYDGLYDALVTEQADVLISALVIRSDQTRDVAYSEPYFNAGQFLAVSRQNADIVAMEDLSGRTLAVELGAQGHVIATEWERQLPDLAVEPYQTPDEALEAVAQGQADAALVDAISARLYLAQNDSLRLLNPPVTVEPFVMVIRKDDERLLQELDTALETLEDNGLLQSIIERHMLTPTSS